ncbi:MAG TPA: THUMP domain-containing protein [Bacteroidales bacterium]|nr:THUMP domain-containing protein [Bacteroidales bacterium]
MSQSQYPIVVKTLQGLEEILAGELRQLGIENTKLLRRGVSFEGTMSDIYRANMFCRTAISVLREIGSFSFESREEFYAKMAEIAWDSYFSHDKTIVISSVATRSEVFSNTLFLSQLSKDAVVDYFRAKTGQRPTVNKDEAQIRLSVYVNNDRCIVSLDSSGEPLFKRGYRREGGMAPLNEVLASGLIMLAGWDKKSTFIDPMCGSGTFAIEAGLMAAGIAPGSLGRSFSFEHWNDFEPHLWDQVMEEAQKQRSPSVATIMASDMNPKIVEVARKNMMEAGLLGQIRLQRQDFFHYYPPSGGGWVLLNPPYGQRLKNENLNDFYKSIGDILKKSYPGYRAGIINSDVSSIKSIGLKPLSRTTVYNGSLECKFMVFELFSGPHKEHVIATRPKRKRIEQPENRADSENQN